MYASCNKLCGVGGELFSPLVDELFVDDVVVDELLLPPPPLPLAFPPAVLPALLLLVVEEFDVLLVVKCILLCLAGYYYFNFDIVLIFFLFRELIGNLLFLYYHWENLIFTFFSADVRIRLYFNF